MIKKEYLGFTIKSFDNGNYHFEMTDKKKKEMKEMATNRFQFEIEKLLNYSLFMINQVNGYIYLEIDDRLYEINSFYELSNRFEELVNNEVKKVILYPMKRLKERVIKTNMKNGY